MEYLFHVCRFPDNEKRAIIWVFSPFPFHFLSRVLQSCQCTSGGRWRAYFRRVEVNSNAPTLDAK